MFQKSSADATLAREESVSRASQDTVETVVGPSVIVEGDFSSEGDIIVKGTVSGSVHTSKSLRVEENAKIFANIKAGTAIVAGTIRGNAKIADRLELAPSGRVAGDVECKVLVVEAGALINGKLIMAGMEDDIKPEKKTNFGRIKAKVIDRDMSAPAELS